MSEKELFLLLLQCSEQAEACACTVLPSGLFINICVRVCFLFLKILSCFRAHDAFSSVLETFSDHLKHIPDVCVATSLTFVIYFINDVIFFPNNAASLNRLLHNLHIFP